MKEFIIDGKTIQFDDQKEYYDHFREGTAVIDFGSMLTNLERGELDISGLKEWLLPQTRWITEAHRKRFYRTLTMNNPHVVVMSGENFFVEEGGDEIIDNLENTGKFTRYLLRTLFNCNMVTIAKDGGVLDVIMMNPNDNAIDEI